MNRMEVLKNYRKKEDKRKSDLINELGDYSYELENMLFHDTERIKETCLLVKQCIEYGYITYKTITKENRHRHIMANGIYHNLGFYRMDNTVHSNDSDVIGIGIKNGGANGIIDIVWDFRRETLVFYNEKTKTFHVEFQKEYYPYLKNDIKKFMNQYQEFMNGFLDWFDMNFKEGEK